MAKKKLKSAPKTYRCVIEIDVDASSPRAAARLAWELLASYDARLPVVRVREGRVTHVIDLGKSR